MRMCQPSGCGIWEELKSNCVTQSGSCAQLLSHSAFDFIVVVVAQFRLPISEHVAKIHFAVHSCDLRPFHSCCMCCHALNNRRPRSGSPHNALHSLVY